MDSTLERTPAVVVGGGLARLTTAAYLARNGQDVTLYEKSPTLGAVRPHSCMTVLPSTAAGCAHKSGRIGAARVAHL